MKLFGKKSKILAAAIAMMTLSTAAAVTGTVAWFTANNMVTVSGMSVNTSVDSNLLIADISTENSSDAVYTTGPLVQTRTGKLKPASTIDGEAFFYHTNDHINGSGAATDGTYVSYSETTSLTNANAGKDKYDADFQTAYGITDSITTSNVIYGYVDYSFYIKATNASNSAQAVKLTRCNLLYDGGVLQIKDKAWRTAMLVLPVNEGVAGASNGTLSTILTPAGAHTFSFEDGVTPEKAVKTISALDEVTYNSAANIASSLAAGATQRYKVLIRLWLEGEDTSCNNDTYADLTNNWALDLKIELGGSNAAVTNIGSSLA